MFSERLKNLRKEKKISQMTLSQALELGRSTITQYETGSRTPDYQTLLKIARYFSVSVDYLLGNSAKRQEDAPIQVSDGQITEKVFLFPYRDPHYQVFREDRVSDLDFFLFQVLDDNMKNARIFKDDWVLIKKSKEIGQGDIALVVRKNQPPALKKVMKEDFADAELEMIGKVIEVRFKV